MNVLYFGCLGGIGHYLHPSEDGPGGYLMARRLDSLGDVPPCNLQVQGKVRDFYTIGPTLTASHLGEVDVGMWTVLDWWDRSVDKRYGSHSAFLTRGSTDFATILAAGTIAWPQVIARQPVPVTL